MATGQSKTKLEQNAIKSPLTKLLMAQASKLSLSLREIAEGVGWAHTSIVANVLGGRMKIPLDKIKPMSEVLKVDPVRLFKLAHPNFVESIEQIFGDSSLSIGEQKILDIYRKETGTFDACPETDEEIEELRLLVKKWTDKKRTIEDEYVEVREQYKRENNLVR